MTSSSIGLALPCCSSAQNVTQTKCSVATRILAVSLGIIALSAGIMALYGVPTLSALGTTAGIALTATGGLLFLLGVSLRCAKETNDTNEYEFDINLFVNNTNGYRNECLETSSWLTADIDQNIEIINNHINLDEIPYDAMSIEQKRLFYASIQKTETAKDFYYDRFSEETLDLLVPKDIKTIFSDRIHSGELSADGLSQEIQEKVSHAIQ